MSLCVRFHDNSMSNAFRFGTTLLCAPEPRALLLLSRTPVFVHDNDDGEHEALLDSYYVVRVANHDHDRDVRLRHAHPPHLDDDQDDQEDWETPPILAARAGESPHPRVLIGLDVSHLDALLARAEDFSQRKFAFAAPVGATVEVKRWGRSMAGVILERNWTRGMFAYIVSCDRAGAGCEGAPVFYADQLIGILLHNDDFGLSQVVSVETVFRDEHKDVNTPAQLKLHALRTQRYGQKQHPQLPFWSSPSWHEEARARLERLRAFAPATDVDMDDVT